MGCDIHTFIEKKLNGKWLLVDQGNNTRNYPLFGHMAGVRSIEEPMVRPKGLPEDLSEATQYYVDMWDGDGHTYSWFNKGEIEQLNNYFKNSSDFYNEFGWDILDDDETRLIFWFDN